LFTTTSFYIINTHPSHRILFLFGAQLITFSQSEKVVGKLIEERKSSLSKNFKPIVYLKKEEVKTLDPFTISALLGLQFYKTFLSSDLGSTCRFSPTCSAFGAEIIKHCGVWPGLLLTADRLIRCNSEAEFDNCEHLIDRETGIIYDEVTDY